MAGNFLNLLKPELKPSKNGFDLSRKHVFSTKVGQAKPCLCVETVLGDHFEIDLLSLSRTNTMNTAAFLRGKQRFDFFFVPYSQLWHPFNQFISRRTDKHTVNQNGFAYCPVIKIADLLDYLNRLISSTKMNKDYFGNSLIGQIIENLQLLGYGNFRWLLNDNIRNSQEFQGYMSAYSGKYVNLFRLAAFQHIWYDFYRNKYWDVTETGGLSQVDVAYGLPSRFDVDMFNFDDLQCTTFANSVLPYTAASPDSANFRWWRLLQPRYIQWKKDLYTSALPGQQFGAVSSLLFSDMVITGNDVDDSDSPFYDGNYLSYNDSSSDAQRSFTIRKDTTNNSTFDVLELRKAEMLQVWKERTLRAGNMVDDAFKAHYGVSPYYNADENVNFLGSFSAALHVNDVMATAATAGTVNGKVGDLAATGTSLIKGDQFKFDCKDFGVIMCVASYLPESEYSADGVDKANTLHEEFDFFTSEYQNIGLEAISSNYYDFRPNNVQSLILGYAPRYYMYKTAVDKVFGEFGTINITAQTGAISKSGSFAPWVAPRKLWLTGTTSQGYETRALNIANMYVNPAVYDSVFGLNVDGLPNTDQLIHDVYFDIKAIRPMSVLGLPEF